MVDSRPAITIRQWVNSYSETCDFEYFWKFWKMTFLQNSVFFYALSMGLQSSVQSTLLTSLQAKATLYLQQWDVMTKFAMKLLDLTHLRSYIWIISQDKGVDLTNTFLIITVHCPNVNMWLICLRSHNRVFTWSEKIMGTPPLNAQFVNFYQLYHAFFDKIMDTVIFVI